VKTKTEQAADKYSDALADLNMAGAVKALCESSLFRTKAGKRFEARIAKLARQHMSLQWRNSERARAALSRAPGGETGGAG
jgi:hypothetical protein